MNEIRNLMLDPRPTKVTKWSVEGKQACTVRMMSPDTSLGMYVTRTAAEPIDAYMYVRFPSLSAGKYVAAFTVPTGNAASRMRPIQLNPVKELTGQDIQPGRGSYAVPFTLEGTGFEYRIQAPDTVGMEMAIHHLLLCTADDWAYLTQLVNAGRLTAPWFAPPINDPGYGHVTTYPQ